MMEILLAILIYFVFAIPLAIGIGRTLKDLAPENYYISLDDWPNHNQGDWIDSDLYRNSVNGSQVRGHIS